MDKPEYEQLQHTVIMVGNLMEDQDCQAALDAISKSEVTGIFLMAPMAYQAAQPRIRAYAKCLSAMQQFQAAFAEFKDVVANTEGTVARVRGLVPGSDGDSGAVDHLQVLLARGDGA